LGNTLAIESPNGLIKWCHFEYLHQLQTELSLKFANKLTGVHIGWKNNKMKVKLAAQLLSSSTAKALQYLKDNNFQRFGDCEATIEYCKSIDQIFDFLNSRCPFSKGYKSPIFKSNIHFLQDKIIPLINYLSTLKFKNQLLYTTNKKTFILGFTAAVRSIFEISKTIFTENLNFKYIITYNFSQDHIEMLFGRIRQRYGTNNNPTVLQFKTAMKQILIKNSIKCSENSNCNSFDNDITASIFSFTHSSKNKKNLSDNFDSDYEKIDEDILNRSTLLDNKNSCYKDCKNNIMYYICGYVVKKIIAMLDCTSCIQSFIKPYSEHNYSSIDQHKKFVSLRNNGGLTSASLNVFKIISETEKYLLLLTDDLKKLNIQNLDLKIIFFCNKKFSLDQNIFKNLSCNVPLFDRPHKMLLISLLVKKYLSIRLHSYGKMYSTEILNPLSNRHKLTKHILFMNQ